MILPPKDSHSPRSNAISVPTISESDKHTVIAAAIIAAVRQVRDPNIGLHASRVTGMMPESTYLFRPSEQVVPKGIKKML